MCSIVVSALHPVHSTVSHPIPSHAISTYPIPSHPFPLHSIPPPPHPSSHPTSSHPPPSPIPGSAHCARSLLLRHCHALGIPISAVMSTPRSAAARANPGIGTGVGAGARGCASLSFRPVVGCKKKRIVGSLTCEQSAGRTVNAHWSPTPLFLRGLLERCA